MQAGGYVSKLYSSRAHMCLTEVNLVSRRSKKNRITHETKQKFLCGSLIIPLVCVMSACSLSHSRIFVKILFQELAEFMGMAKLNDRLRDP